MAGDSIDDAVFRKVDAPNPDYKLTKKKSTSKLGVILETHCTPRLFYTKQGEGERFMAKNKKKGKALFRGAS